jgi:hypothetical protein
LTSTALITTLRFLPVKLHAIPAAKLLFSKAQDRAAMISSRDCHFSQKLSGWFTSHHFGPLFRFGTQSALRS